MTSYGSEFHFQGSKHILIKRRKKKKEEKKKEKTRELSGSMADGPVQEAFLGQFGHVRAMSR